MVYHNATGPSFWETKIGIPTILGKGASRDNKKRCCFHGIVNKIVRILIYTINYCYFGCKMGYNLSFVCYLCSFYLMCPECENKYACFLCLSCLLCIHHELSLMLFFLMMSCNHLHRSKKRAREREFTMQIRSFGRLQNLLVRWPKFHAQPRRFIKQTWQRGKYANKHVVEN